MRYKYDEGQLSELIADARERRLLLPNFQRRFEWKTGAQSSLAASVLLGIPSGALLLFKGHTDEFSAKALGERSPLVDASTSRECMFLLDGQQRLSSLRQVFGDPYRTDWSTAHGRLYKRLWIRWSLSLAPEGPDSEHEGTHAADDGRNSGRLGLSRLQFEEPPLEPESLAEWLVPHTIRKKDNEKGTPPWFHPALIDDESRLHELTASVVEEAARRMQIPLWGVASSAEKELDAVTDESIDKIADARAELVLRKFRDQTLDADFHDSLVIEAETKKNPPNVDPIQRLLEKRSLKWAQDVKTFLLAINDYTFPVIRVPEGELAQAVVIFEAINISGKRLSTFDLVAAKYAKMGKQGSLALMLADMIEKLDSEFSSVDTSSYERRPGLMLDDNRELTGTFENYFHQGLALRSALGDFSDERIDALTSDDVKSAKALSLTPEQIDDYWQEVTQAIYESWRFLQVDCSVPSEGALRNKLLMIPLIAAHLIPDRSRSHAEGRKLAYWFWVSTLTSRYGSEQNRRAIEDTKMLVKWLIHPKFQNPFTHLSGRVMNDTDYSDKSTLLGERPEDVTANVGDYLCMFVNSQGGRDLLSGDRLHVWEAAVDRHHIVPLGSVTTVGQSTKELRSFRNTKMDEDSTEEDRRREEFGRLMNSPLNFCYLSKESNEKISSMDVARYVDAVAPQTLTSLCLPIDKKAFAATVGQNDQDRVRGILSERHDKIREAWHRFEAED